MGGRGLSSEMSRSNGSGGASNIQASSGKIGDNTNGMPRSIGAHSNAVGTTYFGTGTSEQQLINFAENSSYVNKTVGGMEVKGLGFDVVGSFGPDYPSGNLMSAHALVFHMSDGSFSLDFTRPSGSTTSRTYGSEASAMKAGRNALVKFIRANYGNK